MLPLGTANDFAAALGISMASEPPCMRPFWIPPNATSHQLVLPLLGCFATTLVCRPNGQATQPHTSLHGTTHTQNTTTHHYTRTTHSSSRPQDPLTALALALDPTAPRAVDVGAVNGHAVLNDALVRLWATHCGLCRACRTRNSPLHPLKTTHNNCAAEQAGGVSAVPEEELSSPLKRLLGPLGIALHGAARVCVAD